MTPQMRQTLEAIKKYQATHGVAPSHQELAFMLGLHSKSGVNRLLNSLEERGYIRRLSYKARAIELVENPTFAVEGVSHVPLLELIREIKRRGLVVGRVIEQVHYTEHDTKHVVHKFKELTEEEYNAA